MLNHQYKQRCALVCSEVAVPTAKMVGTPQEKDGARHDTRKEIVQTL
jgi:hypothetical protein